MLDDFGGVMMAIGHDGNEIEKEAEELEEETEESTESSNGVSEASEAATEGEEASSPEEESRYAFPEAAVVRVMKKHLDKEKMVKKEVKIAMNQWLERACSNIAKEMNKVPYVMVTLNEFRQGVKVYDSLEEFDMEKQRILAHMEAFKKDIERLERDLGKLTFNPDGVR
ncbi:MAG: NFYB/HAP3 family transcription factor subunit [Candidatus Aenigmarchaeota archaeon]|nr:NFYB/HAP3 family transcription factor subunit [Candidatus Aenigmarchaeota archaeon]